MLDAYSILMRVWGYFNQFGLDAAGKPGDARECRESMGLEVKA